MVGDARTHVPKASRHPEVNQENTTTFESNNQILAAPLQCFDALLLEARGHVAGLVRTDEAMVGDLDAFETAPDECRLESAAHGLDLG